MQATHLLQRTKARYSVLTKTVRAAMLSSEHSGRVRHAQLDFRLAPVGALRRERRLDDIHKVALLAGHHQRRVAGHLRRSGCIMLPGWPDSMQQIAAVSSLSVQDVLFAGLLQETEVVVRTP